MIHIPRKREKASFQWVVPGLLSQGFLRWGLGHLGSSHVEPSYDLGSVTGLPSLLRGVRCGTQGVRCTDMNTVDI